MLLMGLLALARAATVAGDTHGGATCNATMLFGTTIGTGNLSSHHAGAGGSDASCCAACLAEPACLAFVVDKHTCFLKANLDGRRPKSGNMAGIVRGSLPPTPAPKPAPRPPPAPPQPTAGLAWADSFGSHMVIQQLPALTVLWGFASPGAIVSAQRLLGSAGTPASANSSNTTGVDGVWWLTLPGRPAGNETFAFHASVRGSSAAAIEMEDVVYGDVWVCSGQSNMAVVVGQVFNASDVLREAEAYATEPTNPLRLFAANMSCGHGKVCHFKQDQNHLSPCTRPPCFTTGPNAGWTPTSAAVLSSDGKGNPLPVWSGSFSAVCYLFGRRVQATRQYPVGLISSYIGGTPDECWSSKEASAACPATPTSNAHMDYGDCWYSMITPLLRTPIFGAIFYQGETDTDVGGASKVDAARAVGYNCTFHAMLNDWRAKFHQASGGLTVVDFPFGIVQLAPWGVGAGKDANNGCGESTDCEVAQVRWAQELVHRRTKNTFLAVTTDLADFDSPYGSIHPRHKIPVGDRLALGARRVAYKEPGVYAAGPGRPVATAAAVGTGGVHVQFSGCAAGGIQLRETVGFEVSSGGSKREDWRAVAVVPNATAQAECSVELDQVASAGASWVRYNWFRSTCFANETTAKACGKVGCGAGRCAVYSGGAQESVGAAPRTPQGGTVPVGLPAAPFLIEVVAHPSVD